MADYLGQVLDLARGYVQAKGATISLKLNAWPGEIPIANASDLSSPSGPGLLHGQVIIRDAAGNTMQTIGPDIRQNWLLTAAVVGGLALVVFVVVRGALPRKGK
jgi:hypothetical protein